MTISANSTMQAGNRRIKLRLGMVLAVASAASGEMKPCLAGGCDSLWGVHPTVDRVEALDCDPPIMVIHFGYYSGRTEPEGVIFAEENNQLCPGSSHYPGQPITFYPGRHREVFSVPVSVNSNFVLTWHVGDNFVTADADMDADGILICSDNCLDVSNPDQADSDSDGVGDACDGCLNDPEKTEPGICGCGTPDSDSDSDGVPDCFDGCPLDPAKVAEGACGCGVSDADSDSDGVADCLDPCPNDPNKLDPGFCGCGTPELDENNDRIPDCLQRTNGPAPATISTNNTMIIPPCAAGAELGMLVGFGLVSTIATTGRRVARRQPLRWR